MQTAGGALETSSFLVIAVGEDKQICQKKGLEKKTRYRVRWGTKRALRSKQGERLAAALGPIKASVWQQLVDIGNDVA